MLRPLGRVKVLIPLILLVYLTAVGCGSADQAPAGGLTARTGAKLGGDFSGSGPGTLTSAYVLQDVDLDLRDAASLAARITYTSTSGIDNNPSQVTGAVFVPRGDPHEAGWPVIGLGHPTTGVKHECAPSLSRNFSNLAPTIVGLVKAGLAVVVPDYQGLGSEETYHPYLDSTTAGFNLIDAVRAARRLDRTLSDRWVALGADQGGQAAWAANELMTEYGADLNLEGSISLAPFTGLTGLADAAAAGALTKEQKLQLVAYLAALKNGNSDFDLDAYRRGIVQEKWDLLLACEGAEVKERDEVATQIGADDLRPANPAAADTLRGFLQKMSLPQRRAAAPMWVVYGGQDPFTPRAWIEKALERACGYGDIIRIEPQPNMRPDAIDLGRVIPWIKARFEGGPAANDCPTLVAPTTTPTATPEGGE